MIVCSFVLCLCLPHLVEGQALSAEEPPSGAQIELLVKDLGSPKFVERELARRHLLRAGKRALPALRKARRSDDPEVRKLALELTAAIWDPLKVEVSGVAFSPDRTRVLLACEAQPRDVLRLRALKEDEDQELFCLPAHATRVRGVCFSPDARFALCTSFESDQGDGKRYDYSVALWDLSAQKVVRRFIGHTSMTPATAFSPDGKRAAACAAGTIRVWDVANGEQVRALEKQLNVMCLSFSPDGQKILSGGGDITIDPAGRKYCTIRLWDLTTGAEVRVFRVYEGPVYALAFSPDGRRIVSGTGHSGFVDGKLVHSLGCFARVWDVENGKELLCLEGHQEYVIALAFSSDGRRVLSGARDQTVRLWDVETGKELARFDTNDRIVCGVAFLEGGKRAVSVTREGAIEFWDLPK